MTRRSSKNVRRPAALTFRELFRRAVCKNRSRTGKSPLSVIEQLESRELLSATWIDETNDVNFRYATESVDTRTPFELGTIGTSQRPVVTFTGGLAAFDIAGIARRRDSDDLNFTLSAPGNESAKLLIKLTPTTIQGANGFTFAGVPTTQGSGTSSTVNLADVTDSNAGTKLIGPGGFSRQFFTSNYDTRELSLDGAPAGNYTLSVALAKNLRALLPGYPSVLFAYEYEAVIQSFPTPAGNPDASEPLTSSVSFPTVNASAPSDAGKTTYFAGRLEGSAAPGTYRVLPDSITINTKGNNSNGVSFVDLSAETGTLSINAAPVTIRGKTPVLLDNGTSLVPTVTSTNHYQWSVTGRGREFFLPIASDADFSGTGYQLFVESYPTFPAASADFTEATLSESGASTRDLGIVSKDKPTTTVSGLLRSYSKPGTLLGSSLDIDTYKFKLPSRGVTGSEVIIKVAPDVVATNKIKDLVKATLKIPGRANSLDVQYRDSDSTIRFDLTGVGGGAECVLELQSATNSRGATYSIDITHPRPTVTLGNVVSLSEGFGYGTTIAGRGKSVDAVKNGSLNKTTLSNPIALSATNKMTVEGWFYPKGGNDATASIAVLSDTASSTSVAISQTSNRGIQVQVRRDPGQIGDSFDVDTKGVLNTDAWNHLALTFDGQRLQVFVNGVSVNAVEDTQATGLPRSLKNISHIRLDGGMHDEFRIWNIARTQAEIQGAMLTPLTGSEAGLVGYWNFDNPTSTGERDLSSSGNELLVPADFRVENAAPQIGYVDVTLSSKVTSPIGLFVTYALSGTAKFDDDFVGSRFRKVSGDANSETNGIIIPFGESTGRIYFTARPDAIAESNETINVSLTPYSFEGVTGGEDYVIGTTRDATVTLTDNGAYRPGVAITDATGRPVTAASPLYIDPKQQTAKFYVRLTSQPTTSIARVIVQPDSVSYVGVSGRLSQSIILDFTKADWDAPQEVTLSANNFTSITDRYIEFTSLTAFPFAAPGTSPYLNSSIRVPFSFTPSNEARVAEGSPIDAIPVKPDVTLRNVRDVNEDASEPGIISVQLSAPAPLGGLFVKYTVQATSQATSGVDFKALPGFAYVPAGLRETEIPVDPIDDKQAEGAKEELSLVVSADLSYGIANTKFGLLDNTAKLEIYDDDVARIVAADVSVVDVFTPSTTFPASLSTVRGSVVPASSYSRLVTQEPRSSSKTSGEPNNDTIRSAPNLGAVSQLADVLNQSIATRSDKDYFRFTLDNAIGRADTLVAAFSHGTRNDLRLRVVKMDGQPILTSDGASNNEYLDLTSLPEGEYAALVDASPNNPADIPLSSPGAFLTGFSETNYSLRLLTVGRLATKLDSDPPRTEPEPNRTLAEAPQLGTVKNGDRFTEFSISSPTDRDNFRFTLDQAVGRPSSITLLHNATYGALGMQIVNVQTGATVLTLPAQAKSIALGTLSDGTYAVEIYQTGGNVVNTYALAFGDVTAVAGDLPQNQLALRLDTKPTANVTIPLQSNDLTEGTIQPASLTFTPDNWNQFQYVFVTPLADQDFVLTPDTSYTISGTAVSADPFYLGKTIRLDVINVDNGDSAIPLVPEQLANGAPAETLPLVSIRKLTTSELLEGNRVDAFELSVDRPQPQDLVVTIDFRRGTAVLGTDFSFVPILGAPVPPPTTEAGLANFVIPANATKATIRISAFNDQVDESASTTPEELRVAIVDTKNIRVSNTADPGFTDKISIADVNQAGLTILNSGTVTAGSDVILTEEGGAGSKIPYTIKLNTIPTSDITVTVATSDPGEAQIAKTENGALASLQHLVFTSANWNVPQTVYAIGVDDNIADGNANYLIGVSVQGDDEPYHSLPKMSFPGLNNDNERVGVEVTSPRTTVNGRDNVFSVKLKTQPTGEVRVTMKSPDQQLQIEGARAGDPYTLRFTPQNWDLPQTVRVTAVDDNIVEYFHKSEVQFKIETGRVLDGDSTSDNSTPGNATDLGPITGGLHWKNVTPDYVNDRFVDKWYRITLPQIGNATDKVRLTTSNLRVVGDLELYDAKGTTLLKSAPTNNNNSFFLREISLARLKAGDYLVRVRPFSDTYDLFIDDADRTYESLKVTPVAVSIKDNDLPVAEMLTGPTPSEVSGEPSYVAVRLNAPASSGSGDTGIKVNFKITGGRARVGNNTNSLLHDYSVIADSFTIDPAKPEEGAGWVRVAPGDVQANIGIVPIDDKAVEDLPLTVRDFDASRDYQLRAAVALDLSSTEPVLTAGTVIFVRLPNNEEIQAVVKTTTTLKRGTYGTPSGRSIEEYAAGVPITITPEDYDKGFTYRGVNSKGRVESEDLQITLLPGEGYTLPKAPDKQGTTGANAADLDPARTQARMEIFDDDTAGVQIISLGQYTTVAEGDEETYLVSLTAEPSTNVTITMTPGEGLQFVTPAPGASQERDAYRYALGNSGVPADLDLTLISVNETDDGLTAVIDARYSRVTYGASATSPKITIAGTGTGGSAQAEFQIPGENDVDFSGDSVTGNWKTPQRLVISNLTANSDGSINLNLTRTDVSGTNALTITRRTAKYNTQPATLTFSPSNWYQLQTVKVRGNHNGIAEPGEWHKDFITYKVTSSDGNWSDIYVPEQEVHIKDAQLDVGETLDGLKLGIGMLEDSLLGLEVPIIGTIGDLPGVGKLFDDFERPLENALATQEESTVSKFKDLADSALSPLVTSGLLDRAEVTPEADENEVRLRLDLEKEIDVGEFDLSSDLGLDALGVQFNTEGKAKATLEFSFVLAFGLSRQFGFFIDTENTGLHMGAKLQLEGNGATADNPNNLFTGSGSIGFLQLEFSDDPNNQTELSITFDATLNDLDNLSTTQFFDINGDGVLADDKYLFPIPQDTNADGRADVDTNGDRVTVPLHVQEPWVNIDATGKSPDFPAVPSSTTDTVLKLAKNANWNKVGSKATTFDEAESIRKEGVYRIHKQGTQSIVYFDADRDGKLDISKRSVNPFATSWTSLTDAQKNGSEIWFSTTTAQLPRELKILTTGAGTAQKFYVDINSNNRADNDELISARLRKKLDKNKNGVLENDINRDGEGRFTQGTSIGFYDANQNGQLDSTEKHVSYEFEPFEIDLEAFSEDANGLVFLDSDGDGVRDPDEILLSTGVNDTVFLDFNGNRSLDSTDIVADKATGKVAIPQLVVNDNGSGPKVSWVDGARDVLTIDGQRFIDLDRDGELTEDDEGRVLEPVARQATELSNDDAARLAGKIYTVNGSLFPSTTAISGQDGATLATAAAKAAKNISGLTPLEKNALNDRVAELVKQKSVVLQPSDGDRLTLTELIAFVKADRSQNASKVDQVKSAAAELFTYQFQGVANLGLHTETSINGSEVLPRVQFDLAVSLPLFNFGNSKDANDNGFSVDFNNVAVDLGTFVNSFVTPIVSTANDLLDPIKPIVKTLNADTKVLGALGLAGGFESDGKPGISLLEIAKKIKPGDSAKIDKAIKFAEHVTKLVDLVDALHSNLDSSESWLQFGNFSMDDLRGASNDPANVASRPRNNTPRTDGSPATSARLPATTAAQVDQQASGSSRFKNKFNAIKNLDGFTINMFEPTTVLSLISGEPDVTLVTYDIPDFNFDFGISRKFSIWGPIAGLFQGNFQVSTDLSMGFDTHGIDEWAKEDFAADKSYLVFDGLFLNDLDENGDEKDELTVKATIAAGAGLDLGIVNGFVKGGIEGIIGLDMVDVGEQSGTSDGKVRGSDIIEKLSTNPADLFDLHGVVNLFLGAEVTVDFIFFSEKVYDKRLATLELARFKLNSNGASGSTYKGKQQTGPIAGSTVWYDVNNNLVRDEGEPFTLTDHEGNYELVIPDDVDQSVGVIRTEGGLDVSTGLEETDDISIPHGETGNATAFTSLEEVLVQTPIDISAYGYDLSNLTPDEIRAAYLNLLQTNPTDTRLDIDLDGFVTDSDFTLLDQLLTSAANGERLSLGFVEQRIKRSFGIDPSVDLSTFAHFDEALEGNPLAGPVIVAENALNSTVTEIESLLAGLAHVSANDHRYSGVFSEAAFIAIGRQMLRVSPNQFDLGDPAQLRTIISDAAQIAGLLLQQRGASISLDATQLALILDDSANTIAATIADERALVALAQTPQDLARLVTEWKVFANGKVSRDLHDVADGTLSLAELVEQDGHTNDETLAYIQSIKLPPLLSAVPAQSFNEDEYVSDVPLTVRRQNVGEGEVTLDVRWDNETLFLEGGITLTEGNEPGEYFLSFYPNEDQYGVAHVTVRATDSAGAVSEETITVTVVPVDEAPRALDDFFYVFAGRPNVLVPLENDIEPDGDPLYLDGLPQAQVPAEIQLPGDGTLVYTPDALSRDLQVLTYDVDDGHGGTAEATITLQPLAPLTVRKTEVRVIEGNLAVNRGRLAHQEGIEAFLSASVGTVIDNGDGTWSWSFDSADGPVESQTVTISATYNDAITDSVTFNLLVRNIAPQFTTLSIDTASTLGELVDVSGAFSDPSLVDTHMVLINWGDGTTSSAEVDQSERSFAGTHAYSSPGTFDVSVTLIDDDRGRAQSTSAVTVTGSPVAGVSRSADGVLTVIATDGRDIVSVYKHNDQLVVATKASGAAVVEQRFNIAEVNRIIMVLGGGNDSATIAPDVTLPVVIYGDDGRDDLHAGGGPSFFIGGAGYDTLIGGVADDTLQGGLGNDRIEGGLGNDQLSGDDGDDVLLGGDGINILLGGNGHDTLTGGRSYDLLIGGRGHDELHGQGSRDVLIGGSAAVELQPELLDALMAKWRTGVLSDPLLSLSSITDDEVQDKLFGEDGNDRLLAGLLDVLQQ